jgi:hypothetical protein
MLMQDINSFDANEPHMKKSLCLFALFLLGAILGLPLGTYMVQHKFIAKEKAMGMLNEEALFDDFAKKEFIYADPQSAREALRYAINVHGEMQHTSTLWGWPEKSDLGWCYGELSLVEESAGNTELARDYMVQAERTLKEVGLKDFSEIHIREVLQRKAASNQSSSGGTG